MFVIVDVEATGISPHSGEMTEFGAVEYKSRATFHCESEPDPENPAKPIITGRQFDVAEIMKQFDGWLYRIAKNERLTFVSDNPAYDFQWINFYFDKYLGRNPFGHSGRRIADFWAGLERDWYSTQKWKKYRVTPHDHNPVNDAMGNVEALHKLLEMAKI